ncbi:MAG: HAD family hydrolase [Spirochaetales bacterium]|nr:MAG: HAD family hydrolase [Spirochaetales bacterium]
MKISAESGHTLFNPTGEAYLRIKAVVFDVDGTLYPNRLMYIKSVSFFFSYPRFTVHFGKIRRRIRTIRPIDDFQKLQRQMLADSMKISLTEADRYILEVMYTEWEECLKGMPAYPFVRETMENLRARGLTIGVLSDFPIGRKLAYLGLDSLVDFALTAEQSGYLKPNPEPFRLVSGTLAVPPEEVLFVGNHYEYDILGASSFGMKTAHLTGRRIADSPADFSFRSYEHFMEKLDSC